MEEQGMSSGLSPLLCDDQINTQPYPVLNSYLMVRRQFLHVKREARVVHTRQQAVHVDVTQEIKSVMTVDAGLEGFVLPPPFQ